MLNKWSSIIAKPSEYWWYYTCKATNSNGTDWSNNVTSVIAKPNATSNLAAGSQTSTSITYSWDRADHNPSLDNKTKRFGEFKKEDNWFSLYLLELYYKRKIGCYPMIEFYVKKRDELLNQTRQLTLF